MEAGTVQERDALDQHVFATGESDHVVAYLFLVINVVNNIWSMFQMERIPDVAFLVEGTTHLLELVPFHIAHLASLHRSPPFTVSVDGSFTGDGNVLALAGIDGWCGAVLLLSGFFVYLDEVVLVF